MNAAKLMSETIRLGSLLAISGGFMDAYSYIYRDHVFANAQTGNILLCPACSQETVDKMAQVLETEKVKQKDMVAFVRCAGDAAGKERLAGLDSCEAAKEAGLLHSECQWGCLGIGSCIERCEFGAMSLEDGSVHID